MFKLYRYFLGGMPICLLRHYWWAYLWPKSVWFFDHQMIINTILFGQYQKLMQATLLRLEQTPGFDKQVEIISQQSIFAPFYRVTEFKVIELLWDESPNKICAPLCLKGE